MNSDKPAEQQNPTALELNFDELVSLALNDPDAFEEERCRYIESFLDSVPQEKRKRLLGLQWQIDQVRKLARTPMASCIAISNMMKESLEKLKTQHFKLLEIGQEPLTEFDEPEPVNATILPFSKH